MGLQSGLDGLLNLRFAALVPLPQDMAVIVGHDGLPHPSGADLAAADTGRDVDDPAGHPGKLGLESGAFGAAGRVAHDRFVTCDRDVELSVRHGRISSRTVLCSEGLQATAV